MQKLLHEMFLTVNLIRESFLQVIYFILVSTCCCSYLCINTNKLDDEKILIVLIAGNSFSKVSEVIRAVKQTSEFCEYCPGYGNEKNPPVRILLYPKAIFWFHYRSKGKLYMCAKLRMVAASNNRDHARNLSCYCLLELFI